MCLFAQTSPAPQPKNLELQLRSEPVQTKIPTAFTILIVNNTDHDLYLPIPSLECGDVPHGAVWLRLNFKSLVPGPVGFVHGCAKNFLYQPIIDRVKKWKHLGPGESLSLATITDRILAQGAGTYDYWAFYYPPGMPKADEDLLQQAGIDFPRNALKSNHLKFVKKP